MKKIAARLLFILLGQLSIMITADLCNPAKKLEKRAAASANENEGAKSPFLNNCCWYKTPAYFQP